MNIDRRLFLSVHAPDVPIWFEPTMPPSPNLVACPRVDELADQFPVSLCMTIHEACNDDDLLADTEAFVQRIACSTAWGESSEATDAQLELLRAFPQRVKDYRDALNALYQWRNEREVQKRIQWSLWWADRVIARHRGAGYD